MLPSSLPRWLAWSVVRSIDRSKGSADFLFYEIVVNFWVLDEWRPSDCDTNGLNRSKHSTNLAMVSKSLGRFVEGEASKFDFSVNFKIRSWGRRISFFTKLSSIFGFSMIGDRAIVTPMVSTVRNIRQI